MMSDKLPRSVAYKVKQRCTVCRGVSLVEVFDLPQLPLTGIYVDDHRGDSKYPKIDQAWMICEECGQGQLKNVLDKEYLYEDTYTHRGGLSPIAAGGNDFFVEFLNTVVGKRKFKAMVDIGCSDLYLLKKLRGRADKVWGVDPIWIGKDHLSPEGIEVIGKYVENIDWTDDISEKPDLIVSAHTFEHIDEAGEELRRAAEAAEPGAIFVVEVPGADSLVSALRFDQVFHQHLNYFSVGSFKRLIAELGCTYLTHKFNYSFWSGTMLMAFIKQSPAQTHKLVDEKLELVTVQRALTRFEAQIMELNEVVGWIKEPIWGYGAAQMAPLLAYHMKSDWGFLQGVLDDNPDRHGKSWPHLSPVIRMPKSKINLDQAAVLVTALDSVRPIMKRVYGLGVRRVILPLNLH